MNPEALLKGKQTFLLLTKKIFYKNHFFREPEDLQSMVRQVATACGAALLPFVDILDDANMKTIAVRFAMGADLVNFFYFFLLPY